MSKCHAMIVCWLLFSLHGPADSGRYIGSCVTLFWSTTL
uniref:Uncharacterized protein n=1 Tax=Arundo donax TaxID=35708 RepID=A0A0A8Z3X7_ARUDO